MAPYGTPGSFWTQEAAASNLGIALLPRADETWAPVHRNARAGGPHGDPLTPTASVNVCPVGFPGHLAKAVPL